MLISPITERWITGYIAKPKVALLVDCPRDLEAGMQIANTIYEALIPEKNNPPIIISLKDKKSIGIEDIREFKQSLSLRANKKDGISRFVIIEDASKLTVEAQNSLLKIIEELPKNTLIVLIVSDNNTIIQTIKSRCFTLPVLPIRESQALQYANEKGVDEVTAKKMYNLSEGRSSDYITLLNNENSGDLEEIELAKKFLSSSVVERQNIIETVTGKDHDSLYFLNALKITAKAGMYHSKSNKIANNWKNILKAIVQTEEQLKQNVATKLALLSLSVTI